MTPIAVNTIAAEDRPLGPVVEVEERRVGEHQQHADQDDGQAA